MNTKILSVAVASLIVGGTSFAQSTTESQKKTTTTESYNQPATTTQSGDMNTQSGDTAHSAKVQTRKHKARAKHQSKHSRKAESTSASMNQSSADMNDRTTSANTRSDLNTRSDMDRNAQPSNNMDNRSSDTSAYSNQNYNNNAAPTYQRTTTTEEYNTTSSAPMGTGTSYGVNTYAPEHTLRSETVSFAPQFGVVTFTDATGQTDSRGTAGLGLNFNMIPSSPENPKNVYLGLSTGAFYSHLGGPGSNFWGSNDRSGFNQGANLVLIPADLKLGYNISDRFRASLHGGGNVLYRSAPEAAILGSGSDVNTNSWAILPNAGVDLEWQVGDNVAIIARPDVTIAPGNNMFVGTLGATIMPSF